MRFTVAVLTMSGMMAFGAFSARGTVAAQQPKSQWDGVYTEDQAKRGEGLYSQYLRELPRSGSLRWRNGARPHGW